MWKTVMTPKGSCKSKDNLTGAEKNILWALKANDELMALPANKGNVTVVLSTEDCNQKTAALLEDQAYRKLKKDPNESTEQKTVLLMKKPSFSKVCQQGWLHDL
jgi:hypothetical protein